MRKLITLLALLTCFQAFGTTLTKVDYRKLMAMAMKESSQAMLVNKQIRWSLDKDAFESIQVGVELVDEYIQGVLVSTEILPSEENCGCQDIFKTKMQAKKNGQYWTLIPGTLEVEHLVLEH